MSLARHVHGGGGTCHWSIEYGLMMSWGLRVFSYIDEGVRFLCVCWIRICVQFGVLHCYGGLCK